MKTLIAFLSVNLFNSFENVHKVLKDNKYYFVVVGNNRTTAGNENIFIPTDDYIGLIAKKTGFKLVKKLKMTVQKSYMIHSKNAINKESILILKKE